MMYCTVFLITIMSTIRLIGALPSYGYKTYLHRKMLSSSSSNSILDNLPIIVIERKLRPPQINIPRRRMELPFAVVLMRSSYNALDEIDIIPMDEFQKRFFYFVKMNGTITDNPIRIYYKAIYLIAIILILFHLLNMQSYQRVVVNP